MKRFLLLFGLALTLASGTAFADSINTVVDATTAGAGRITATVFNDSGGTLVSGAVVVWDTDDTEFDNTGYPYVTTTTSADHDYVAGVLLTGSCPDQSLCEIVTYGYAPTQVGVTLTEDTQVATSTTASRAGDYSPAANSCALGTLISYTEVVSGNACTNGVLCLAPVFVTRACQ